MARQKNIFKLRGTIGDATFYKTRDGHMIREKGGVDGDRIKTDPKFQRTRENGQEFGYSGRMGKVIRNAFKVVVKRSSDSRLVSRLLQYVMDVLKTDETSTRGNRNLLNGDVTLLQGVEFNGNARLSAVFSAPYTVSLDRVTGSVTVEIVNFVPENQIDFPVGATHCKLVAAAATIDFSNSTHTTTFEEGNAIVMGIQEVPASTLTCNIAPNTPLPVFVALGVFFYQEVNNTLYELRNGGYNAIALVKVDSPI